MEGNVNSNEENDKNNSFQIEHEYQNILDTILFCKDCLMYPDYSIIINSKNSVSLEHICAKKKVVIKPLDLKSKNEKSLNECIYCKKSCENICIRCKKFMCSDCSKDHDKDLYSSKIQYNFNNTPLNSVQNIMECQYICNEHFFRYKYYCPICKINLCEQCITQHYHINLPQLIIKDTTNEINSDNYPYNENLRYLSQILLYCYNKSISNNKMTLNMMLNANLAKNIIVFLKDSKDNTTITKYRIENDFLSNVDNDIYFCKNYGDNEFTYYYSKILSEVSRGNIRQYYKLREIKKKYKNNKIGFYFWDNSYQLSLLHKIEKSRNNFLFSKLIHDSSDIVLDFFNCMRLISNLDLKIRVNQFGYELMKNMCLRMNNKLDLELRRKIGNLISLNIVQKFNDNIEKIEPSIKLLYLSGEKIKNEKKQKKREFDIHKYNLKNVASEKLKNLDNNYKKTLEMLMEIIKREIKDIENGKIKENKKTNILQFKSLNENDTKKAAILNLFFIIKKEMSIEYNHNIHNQTISIYNIMKKELENLGKINESHKSIQKSEKSEKLKDIKSINLKDEKNYCKDKYPYLEKLKTQIQIDKNIIRKEGSIFSEIDFVEIINCSMDDFFNILNKLETSYSIAQNISFKEAIDILFNNEKCGVLNLNPKFKNKKDIMKNCDRITDEEKAKIQQVKELTDKINNRLNENLNVLESLFNNIVNRINNCAEFFDIKHLLAKYKFDEPLNVENAFNSILDIDDINEDCASELYFLIQVILYFFIDSKIKILKNIKNKIQNYELKNLMVGNIYKKKMVDIFITDINKNNIYDIATKTFNNLKTKKEFVDNKILNNYIIDYVKNNNIDNYKNEIISLIGPIIKEINLGEKDPQEIIVAPFMSQQNLFSGV